MKKCRHCGTENKNDSRYCQNCGAELNIPKSDKISFGIKNSIIKTAKIIVIAFIALAVLGMGAHIFLGIPLEPYTEGEDTSHLTEFNIMDIDGDGAISYYEIADIAPTISDYDMMEIFDKSDKNDNGYLIGAEFDGFLKKVEKHYKDMEKAKKKAEEEKQKEEAAREQENRRYRMMNTYVEGKCPECGSDESYIYSYYDQNGDMYYQCTVCDYWTYDYSNFY